MISVLVIMLVVVAVAVAVVLYAAYPARHERLPGAPWLGEAVEQLSEAVPTLDEYDADALAEDASAPRA